MQIRIHTIDYRHISHNYNESDAKSHPASGTAAGDFGILTLILLYKQGALSINNLYNTGSQIIRFYVGYSGRIEICR